MTVDPFPCFERDVHVKPEKSFYVLNIPNHHNQLRHQICSPSTNQIFYLDDKEVWCLDPSRNKRQYFTELPFDPSCAAAAHGWFCAGGHRNGHFLYFRLPNPSHSGSTSMLDVFYTNPAPILHFNHEQLGSAITNSVSIHRLPPLRRTHADDDDEDGDDSDDNEDGDNNDHQGAADTVALITNNDNTVRVFSLENRTELTRLRFEYPMNHATISPDGSLMLIVGDEHYAVIFERVPTGMVDTCDNVRSAGSQWLQLRKLPLYKPPRAKSSGYFTTTWSNSGALCATASELGYVTVFDVAKLRHPDLDPIVAVVPSSRPLTTPGAIRSMCFAPEPFDLLFWTENMGRMCVADMRAGLQARQVVHLDPKAPGVTQIDSIKVNRSFDDPDPRDSELEIDFIRRQQQNLEDDEASLLAAEMRTGSGPGLTVEERQVIEGIRTSRQIEQQHLETRQRDARQSAAAQNSESGPAVSTSSGSNRRSSPQSINYSSTGRRRHQWESLFDATDDLGREHATLNSIRDYLNSRLDEGSRMDALTAIAQHRIRRLEGNTSASSSRPSSSNVQTGGNSTDPWRTIEAAMRAAAPSASSNPASTSASNRNSRQPLHDSDSDSMSELERTQSTSSNNNPSNRTGTRATLPSLRGTSAAYLDSERRRIQELANTANELTTRGQAMYARQRDAERQRGGENSESSSARYIPPGRGGFDANVLRRMGTGTRTMNMGDTPGLYFTPDSLRRNMPTSTDGVDDSLTPESTWGLGTTGLCWGDGGRFLYVGTEDGIFELKINLHERNFWPAITPR